MRSPAADAHARGWGLSAAVLPELWGERLLQSAEALAVSGPRIFDLQIALTSFEGGATELWTHDAAFVSVPGLRVIDPLTWQPSVWFAPEHGGTHILPATACR